MAIDEKPNQPDTNIIQTVTEKPKEELKEELKEEEHDKEPNKTVDEELKEDHKEKETEIESNKDSNETDIPILERPNVTGGTLDKLDVDDEDSDDIVISSVISEMDIEQNDGISVIETETPNNMAVNTNELDELNKLDESIKEISIRSIATKHSDFEKDVIPKPLITAKDKLLKKIEKMNLQDDNKLRQIENAITDYNEQDEAFAKNWVNNRVNPLMTGRVSRVPLTISNYMVEISALSHIELVSLNRSTANADFYRKKEIRFKAIYDHIVYNTIGNISFEEWCRNTKLPDINSLFFGLYDATFPGENTYSIICSNCGKTSEVTRKNSDITCYNFDISSKAYNTLLTNDTILPKKHNKFDDMCSKSILSNGLYVLKKIPTVYDYLNTVKTLSQIEGIKVENIEKENEIEYMTLYIIPFIQMIGLPVITKDEAKNDTEILYFTKIEDKEQICNIVTKLATKDFYSIIMGKQFSEILSTKGSEFTLKKIKCPISSCNHTTEFIPLKMERLFFLTMMRSLYFMTEES